jgi:hypothetical protein
MAAWEELAMKNALDLLQWPAMAVTVFAAWLVASQSKKKRTIGFWAFLVSNVLWMVWGWHDKAYALLVLQVCLAGLNIRGVLKNDPELKAKVSDDSPEKVGRGARASGDILA